MWIGLKLKEKQFFREINVWVVIEIQTCFLLFLSQFYLIFEIVIVKTFLP